MSLDSLKKNLNKKLKGVNASVMSESDVAKVGEWTHTPALDLNRILSGNLNLGLPSKNVVAIVGPEHTMKSSFMILCMVEAQRKGFTPIIIDTERGITDEFCIRWGMDPDNVMYVYTTFIEDVIGVLGQIAADEDDKFIIGIDSIGGLLRKKAMDEAMKDGDVKADQGLLQKDIRLMMKLFGNVCVTKNSIGICTGHMYSRSGTVPMPDQIGGGKAMRLFPNILISLKKDTIKDEDKNVIGNKITATTLKNRLYPPFQTATVEIDYKKGINSYAGLLDLALEADLIKKSGSWYSLDSGEKFQGADKASEFLKECPGIVEKLNKWLEKTGYSTINENVKEAEEVVKEEITDNDNKKSMGKK